MRCHMVSSQQSPAKAANKPRGTPSSLGLTTWRDLHNLIADFVPPEVSHPLLAVTSLLPQLLGRDPELVLLDVSYLRRALIEADHSLWLRGRSYRNNYRWQLRKALKLEIGRANV